jgi:alpha-beta hydrolase superfamily lysophospholipase
MDEATFTDRHGVDVFYRRWPTAEPTGIVVISHGASEHSGRYARFASALGDAGFAVYAVDHRGHGRTAASSGKGRVGSPGGQALIDDLDELVDRAVNEVPNTPVALFGHSLGSLIALAYATRHADRLGSLVLSGFPAALETIPAIREGFAAMSAGDSRDQPLESLSAYNAPFEPARTPFDWLSRDEDEVDAYIADPLCGDDMPLTAGFVADLYDIVAPACEDSSLRAISCPVLLITGENDVAAAMGDNARGLETVLTAADVRTDSRYYPDARHELLNEINRAEATADVIDWLRRQI